MSLDESQQKALEQAKKEKEEKEKGFEIWQVQ